MRLPSEENKQQYTIEVCWRIKSNVPCSESQTRAVPSLETVTTRELSGENAHALTKLVCPLSWSSEINLTLSHIFTVSYEEVITRHPFLENFEHLIALASSSKVSIS
mmetsp:Transcript_11622/g.17344  ORF Transcript_11622/g.17344 Transcript_11622/m.17344 type:complete len:107 (-) Transcript_11622:223-543(-)